MIQVHLNEKDFIAILKPNGPLHVGDFTSAKEVIDTFIEETEKLKGIIVYVKSFSDWNFFAALISHLTFVNGYHKKISKVAFVTDSSIEESTEQIGRHFIAAEIKIFPFDNFEEAKGWILNTKI